MDLLLITPRVPWPPTRADKIRAWHLLEHLATRHRVHLGAFVDDPADWAHAGRLERMCASTCLRPSGLSRQMLRLPAALAGGRPLSAGLNRDPVMRRWIDAHLATGVDACLALSPAAAAMLIDRAEAHPALHDLVECASETWAQRAAEARWPWRWALRREHRLAEAFERAAAWYFDGTIVVSATEARTLRAIAPESAARIATIGNGVDTRYFDPNRVYANPYPADGRTTIVLTGAMDEATNLEAARWIAHRVMPRLRDQRLPVRFAVVGHRPVAAVRRLAAADDIVVTGRVDDVRPWLRHAAAAVAPLRLSRGVPSKVLEAMAMGLPVVATPAASHGIDAVPGEHLILGHGEAGFATTLADLVRDPRRSRALGEAARARVERCHSWPEQLARLDELLDIVAGPRRDVALG